MSVEIDVELQMTEAVLLFDILLHCKYSWLQRGIWVLVEAVQVLIECVLSVVTSVDAIRV